MEEKTVNKKRIFKNIVMVLLVCALAVGMYFTVNDAFGSGTSQTKAQTSDTEAVTGGTDTSNDTSGSSSTDNSQTPPEGLSGESSESGDSQTPPELPSGESSENGDSQTPPEKPSGESSESGDSQTPPEKPSSESSESDNSQTSLEVTTSESTESGDSQTPPELPSGESSENGGSQMPSDMQNGGMSASGNTVSSTDVAHYVLLGVEALLISALALYLIFSRFNKKTFRETFSSSGDSVLYILATAVLCAVLVYVCCIFGGAQASNGGSSMGGMPQSQSEESSVEASGKIEVDGTEQTLTAQYVSETSDESAVLVTNSGTATLDGAVIEKSGDSSNTENSEFYGINAGVLVNSASTATIKNATISTSAKGSNAVFATGEGSKIYISDSTITTTGESSARGLDATYGGYIEADSVSITTQGGSCAALATDRGEGTVTVSNSTLETNGSGSPVIYSTGDISVTSCKGTANGSQMVVIEGKNSATVTSSTLIASASGNRGDVDVCGVFIYQSMSGDADEGTGTFTAKDSSLSIDSSSEYYETAPMFLSTNTKAIINLENTTLNFGSGVLLNAAATDEWGNSGSNGADVTLNATNQTLTGDITADEISSVSINLVSSSLTGAVNGSNSAKEINLTLDASSNLTLTGDTYVTSLTDELTDYSNINFNGYTLYVNSVAVN